MKWSESKIYIIFTLTTFLRIENINLNKIPICGLFLFFWNTALGQVGQLSKKCWQAKWALKPKEKPWGAQQVMMVFLNYHNALLSPETHSTPEDKPVPALYTKHTLPLLRLWRRPKGQLYVIILFILTSASSTISGNTYSS